MITKFDRHMHKAFITNSPRDNIKQSVNKTHININISSQTQSSLQPNLDKELK